MAECPSDQEQGPGGDHRPRAKQIESPGFRCDKGGVACQPAGDTVFRPNVAQPGKNRDRDECPKADCEPGARWLTTGQAQEHRREASDHRSLDQRVQHVKGGISSDGMKFECRRHDELSLPLSSKWRRWASSSASMLFSSRILRTSNSSELPKKRLTRRRTSKRVAALRSTLGV